MKTLILGLGNPIVSDDAVGLRVAEALRARLAGRADVEVSEDYRGGLRLMERMAGYDRAIIIDAIQTGAPAGTVRRLAAGDVPTQRSASSHDVNLPTALELGRRAGLPLPADADVVLIAVEAADIINFGETLTPAVEAAVPRAVEEALRVLDDFAAGAAGEPGGAAGSDERKQGP
jgi:hydrogenase maturation protease